MKRKLSLCFLCWMLLAGLPLRTWAAQRLIPVGEVIGLQLQSDTVTVAAYDEALGQAAREAGLKIGDEIVAINGSPVKCAEDIRQSLTGEAATLTVRRSGRECHLRLVPQDSGDGPKMGVYLRQGVAGIGTVTFYDPETGAFGALGHGVSTPKGEILSMTRGSAYEAQLQSVKRGRPGEPGQLRGTAAAGEGCGVLLKNTPQGVFGVTKTGWPGEGILTAEYEEVCPGEASIRCNVADTGPQDYSVEILKIYPQTRPDGRNFLLKVTDPALLDQTGGVIQGMSGSPICQDGKLVGAVTHVLVNDPTVGYGIFIGNMLEAAG